MPLRLLVLCLSLAPIVSCSRGASARDVGAGADSPRTSAQGTRAAGTASTHDWTRFGYDAARSSASPDPTGIDATNVASLRRQQVAIDGTVDASAIYLHGVSVAGASHDVLFVTTTYGKTLAIDAANGAILWRYTPPEYNSLAGTYRITNSTPVADPDRQSIYAAAPDGYVRKLAVADGRVLWSTAITTLPEREKIASPLNFDRGHVIATTGGYIGDAPPYQGHVAIIDAATGRLLHVWNSLCSDRPGLLAPASCGESGSAIWGRAGAVVDAATGDIYVATGNARWDGRTNWGDAVLELDADATRLLGNYTPANTEELDQTDGDLGSTSPVLLGGGGAGGAVAQGGKDRRIRVLDWARMRGSAPHRGSESQLVYTPSGGGLFTAPAVLHAGATTWLFAADHGGTAAWTFAGGGGGGGGQLRPAWHNDNGGTSPVVAGALLYVYDASGGLGAHGGLRVYEAESGRQVARLACGDGHWNSPIVVDGMVVVPEGNANDRRTTGALDIFRSPR